MLARGLSPRSLGLTDHYIDQMTTPAYRAPTDIPDQAGRMVIITGANSGIGLAAARALAAKGAHVVLAVRDPRAGERAAQQIPGSTEVHELDLADLASVHAFADAWQRPVDLLINNAGVMMPPAGKTVDDFETQFGTNHLGHFALTNRLLTHVGDRVVTVSSMGHRFGNIDFDDLQWERRTYNATRAYGQSKLANLLFTAELQRRLTAAGSRVTATAAHPGYAATNLQRHIESNRPMELLGALGNRVFAQSADAGALPTLYAALADVPGDSYAGPQGFLQQRGKAALVSRSRAAQDPQVARRLWEVSEQLTGTRFPLTEGPDREASAHG